jgi:hypothetical protein
VVVLRHREVNLNKIAKGSVKMKSTLLTVVEKLVLDGEPQKAHGAAAFPDHLVKLRWDGVADPIENDFVHPDPPWIIRWSVVRDMIDEGVVLNSLLHEVTPAGIVGGGGVKDDVHQLVDIEDRGRLKMEVSNDRVFVGQKVVGTIWEAEAGEDDEEDGTCWRAVVAVCLRAAALVSSSSRRSQVAWMR